MTARYNPTLISIGRVLTLCLGFGTSIFGEQPSNEGLINRIEAAWAKRAAAHENVHLAWDEKLFIAQHTQSFAAPPVGDWHQFPKQDTTNDLECSLSLSGDKFRYWVSGMQPVPLLVRYEKREYTIAINGRDNKTLYSGGDGFYPTGFVERLTYNTDIRGVHLLAPMLVCRSGHPELLSLGIGKVSMFAVSPIGATVDGTHCIVLRSPLGGDSKDVSLWLDEKRDFVPIRVVCTVAGNPFYEINCQYKGIGSDAALDGFSYKVFTRDRERGSKVMRQATAKVTSYSTALVPAESFDLKFPIGTWVTDATLDKRASYILKENGEQRMIQPHERRADVTYAMLYSTPSGQALNASSHRSSPWIWVVGLIALGAIVICVLARRIMSQ